MNARDRRRAIRDWKRWLEVVQYPMARTEEELQMAAQFRSEMATDPWTFVKKWSDYIRAYRRSARRRLNEANRKARVRRIAKTLRARVTRRG